MSELQALLTESKSLCVAHQCPECGAREQVTAERFFEGDIAITRCHCRACGHSWHPHVDPETL
jgi:hypothetical protein